MPRIVKIPGSNPGAGVDVCMSSMAEDAGVNTEEESTTPKKNTECVMSDDNLTT